MLKKSNRTIVTHNNKLIMKNKIIFTILILFLFTSVSFSQTYKRKIGLSGTIQGGQFGVLLPIWGGERLVIAPAVDFNFAENIGIDLGLGLANRYYFNNENLSPYIGLKVGVLHYIPTKKSYFVENESITDYIGGLAFGGEYFLSENFSFGVETQANIAKSGENSLRFGNPGGLNFNLATMVSATIYFTKKK